MTLNDLKGLQMSLCVSNKLFFVSKVRRYFPVANLTRTRQAVLGTYIT